MQIFAFCIIILALLGFGYTIIKTEKIYSEKEDIKQN